MKRAREWIKDYLIPVNTLIVFAGFLVSALDAAAPVARPYTRGLTVMAACAAAVLLAGSLLPLPQRLRDAFQGRPWLLWMAFLATFTAGGFFSLAHGTTGALGERFEGVAGMQQAIFDLKQDIRALAVDTKVARVNTEVLRVAADAQAKSTASVQQDLAQVQRDTQAGRARSEQVAANTDYIRRKMDDPAAAAAEACKTVSCALASGAKRSQIQRMLDEGQRIPPDTFGPAMRILIRERNANRFDILDLYLHSGALSDVNAKAARLVWSGDLQDAAHRAGSTEAGSGRCRLASLRPLELATLLADKEMQKWLLRRGADPELMNQWCRDMTDSASFSAGRLTGNR